MSRKPAPKPTRVHTCLRRYGWQASLASDRRRYVVSPRSPDSAVLRLCLMLLGGRKTLEWPDMSDVQRIHINQVSDGLYDCRIDHSKGGPK